MSKICQITGKKAMVGNNVSHSKRRTKRKFDVNLFNKKFFWVEEQAWITLTISAEASVPSTRRVSTQLSKKLPPRVISTKSNT